MDQASERNQYTARILASTSRHRLIVAGAGTGKTYTFKEILKALGGNSALAITFINNLAKDMARELGSLADVRTFHSFCKMLLHRMPSPGISTSFHFFPMLGRIIASDARTLRRKADLSDLNFDWAFLTLSEDDGRIAFYLERADCYDAVGFEDGVFRVLSMFREDPSNIPSFACVLVDEFQDFCALEVAFIEQLRTKSPMLIVGDDDQALYAFRGASAEFLRERARSGEFEKFDLPYCSRCTEVIVNATNNVLQRAAAAGHLSGRLDKPYTCYLPDKGPDSAAHPLIYRVHCTVESKKTPYVSAYISSVLESIPSSDRAEAKEKGYPVALIIGPPHYLRKLAQELEGAFDSMELRLGDKLELSHLDAYRVLLRDESANLGWRVLLELEGSDSQRRHVLSEFGGEPSQLRGLLEQEWVAEHLHFLQLLRACLDDPESLAPGDRDSIQQRLDLSVDEVTETLRKGQKNAPDEEGDDSTAIPEGLLCTFPGAKGLSGGYVFVVGMSEGILPRKNAQPTDAEICQFVVALTRTRKECHVISVGRFAGVPQKRSAFLWWLPNKLVKDLKVTKVAVKRAPRWSREGRPQKDSNLRRPPLSRAKCDDRRITEATHLQLRRLSSGMLSTETAAIGSRSGVLRKTFELGPL